METHSNRNLWIDYLRSALTVLVVAHHSTLAYTTFASFDKVAYINSTHPIVDTKRWVGLDIFENFNDVFFMSLMFLIGGLFLSKSVHKKGVFNFIKDRVYRLLLPFILGGTILMLIAHFPSYYIAHDSTDVGAYIKDFFVVEQWPVGPPWFIWVLFAFNLVFAISHPIFNQLNEKIGQLFSSLTNRPFVFLIVLFLITWILYVPVAYSIGAGTWTGIGPFDFQLSRILLYFGYFMVGVWIGNASFNTHLFSLESGIVSQWWLWLTLSLAVYFALIVVGLSLPQAVKDKKLTELAGWMIYYSIYVASCTLSSIAFITVFRRFIHLEKSWWNSLSDNAYLIYLTHYVFVTWTQFSLLSFDIPAVLKFLITFIVALVLSWSLSILLRKVTFIKKYL